MSTTPPPYPIHKDPNHVFAGGPVLFNHPNLSTKSLELWPARIMMFEVVGIEIKQEFARLVLPYLPEELKRGTRAKTTVRQTQTSAWVDKYGDALPIWHISGTTGWRKRWYDELGRWLDGYEAWNKLEGFFRYYQEKTRLDAEIGREGPRIKFYNFYDEEYWVVEPIEVNKYRNARRALLIGYEIKLVGLERLDEEQVRAPGKMPDAGVFLGDSGLFLIELQRQLEFLQAMLSQIHLILGATGASADVLRAAAIVQIGVGIAQANIKNLQFGNVGTFGLSTEDVLATAQSILQFAKTLSGSTAIAVTGAVIQLVALLNTTAISMFQLPSRIDLFSGGSFTSALTQEVEIQTPIFPGMV